MVLQNPAEDFSKPRSAGAVLGGVPSVISSWNYYILNHEVMAQILLD